MGKDLKGNGGGILEILVRIFLANARITASEENLENSESR
jgi:hypothetical protein